MARQRGRPERPRGAFHFTALATLPGVAPPSANAGMGDLEQRRKSIADATKASQEELLKLDQGGAARKKQEVEGAAAKQAADSVQEESANLDSEKQLPHSDKLHQTLDKVTRC